MSVKPTTAFATHDPNPTAGGTAISAPSTPVPAAAPVSLRHAQSFIDDLCFWGPLLPADPQINSTSVDPRSTTVLSTPAVGLLDRHWIWALRDSSFCQDTETTTTVPVRSGSVVTTRATSLERHDRNDHSIMEAAVATLPSHRDDKAWLGSPSSSTLDPAAGTSTILSSTFVPSDYQSKDLTIHITDAIPLPQLKLAAAVWRTAIDPASGRTYFYHAQSYETTWETPAAVRDYDTALAEHDRQEKQRFFRQMEQNIVASMARGERIPGIPADTNLVELMSGLWASRGSPNRADPTTLLSVTLPPQQHDHSSTVAPVPSTDQALWFAVNTPEVLAANDSSLMPSSPHPMLDPHAVAATIPLTLPRPVPNRIRTISSMNEGILSQVSGDRTSSSDDADAVSRNGHRIVTGTATTLTQPALSSSSSSSHSAVRGSIPIVEGRPPMPPSRLRTSSRDVSATGSATAALPANGTPSTSSESFAPLSPTNSPTDEDDNLAGEFLISTPVVNVSSKSAVTDVDTKTNDAPAAMTATPTVPLVPRPTAINQSHSRRNTGGTIYVQSTMSNPDVDNTIKCVCGVYRAHIVQTVERAMLASPISPTSGRHSPVSVSAASATASSGLAAPVPVDVFCDDYDLRKISTTHTHGGGATAPIMNVGRWNSATPATTEIPSLADLSNFYQEFYRRSQMEHDTIIMSLIYVERLIKETHGAITPSPTNWRSILFSCMVLSSKVWDDLSMWNIDFSNVSAAVSGFSYFSLQRINQLELAVLSSLNFDVRVPASEYFKYYSLIRTMLIRSGLLAPAAVPLGRDAAHVLEMRTSNYQDTKLHGRGSRRCRSVDWSCLGVGMNASDSPYRAGETPNNQNDNQNLNPSMGPVLKDQVCLEQLVSIGAWQK